MDTQAYPITLIIIAINIVVSMIGINNQGFMGRAIMWPYGVKRQHQYYRFISSGFIHADYMHLIFNMFTFYFFGRNLELIFKLYALGGIASFLTLYILALIISDLPTYFKNQEIETISAWALPVPYRQWSLLPLFSVHGPASIYMELLRSQRCYMLFYILLIVSKPVKNVGTISIMMHIYGVLYLDWDLHYYW